MNEENAVGDPDVIDAVTDHVNRHIGETEVVLHEDESPVVHIDLIPVPPSDDLPFHVVVTCGMAARPMHPPPDYADLRWTELLVLLPPDWPITEGSIHDERNWWPLRLLKTLARYPHVEQTALWQGHTYDHEEPLWEGSPMSGAILSVPFPLPEDFWAMPHPHHPDEEVAFHLVVPVHDTELQLAREEGASALWERFEGSVDAVIDPQRPSAV